jgi:hypothetical protein
MALEDGLKRTLSAGIEPLVIAPDKVVGPMNRGEP